MIYFDNAATSFPKPREVLEKVDKYIRHFCGNPGRSAHALAVRAAEEVYAAREAVAALVGADAPEKVVFTQNATHALNIAIKSALTQGCHVLTSDTEHNSVIRPLEKLKRTIGIDYSLFSLKGDLYENLNRAIRADTTAVICTMASNVTGARADASALSRFCAERGLNLILDASQLAGHERIDLSKTPCSILCAPGHKALFGLQGSGFAVFNERILGETILEGGNGSDSKSTDMPLVLPERHEAGTLATPSIVSLAEGIKYVRSVGEESISRHLSHLTDKLTEAIHDIHGITTLATGNGIVLFKSESISSESLAFLLGEEKICTRGGLHCAPSAHRLLGTLEGGAVRVSFSFLNNEREVKMFVDKLNMIVKSN